MKRSITDDGERTHTLTITEKRAVRKCQVIVEEAIFVHRNTREGGALANLFDRLRTFHDGNPLFVEPPSPADTGSDGEKPVHGVPPVGDDEEDLLQSLLSRVPGASILEADNIQGEALAANQSRRLTAKDFAAIQEACQRRRGKIAGKEGSGKKEP